MTYALCPSDGQNVKWQTNGEGVSRLMYLLILLYFLPWTSKSTPIPLWDSPCKTPFLPLTVPRTSGFGCKFLKSGAEPSLLLYSEPFTQVPTDVWAERNQALRKYLLFPIPCKIPALGEDVTINLASATATTALDKTVMENTGGM